MVESESEFTRIDDRGMARAQRRFWFGVVGIVASGMCLAFCLVVLMVACSGLSFSSSGSKGATSVSTSSSSGVSESDSSRSGSSGKKFSSVRVVDMPWGSDELCGLTADEVVHDFESCGFEQVTVESDSDIDVRTPSGSDTVTSVIVGGTKRWDKGVSFAVSDKVRVVCHVEDVPSQPNPEPGPATSEPVADSVPAKESVPEGSVAAPGGRYDFSGLSYEDVRHQFEQAGFTNIVVEADPDLITGWLHDDGDIENVTVDGRKDYKKGDAFAPDVPVRIQYHTWSESAQR